MSYLGILHPTAASLGASEGYVWGTLSPKKQPNDPRQNPQARVIVFAVPLYFWTVIGRYILRRRQHALAMGRQS